MANPGQREFRHAATTAADPRSSEDARQLLQQRLALLGLVTMCLSGGFFVFAVIGDMALDGVMSAAETLQHPRRFLNLAGALVSAAVWLGARSGVRSAFTLIVLDAVGTTLAVVPYTAMAMEQGGLIGVLMTALMVMLVLMTRSLMVPSDPRRTFWIGISAAGLSLAIAGVMGFGGYEASGTEDLPHLILNLGLWLAVAVAVATIASWVLFGLREQVQEARRLGQYILLEKLGEGGMGMVYRAQHALLRRPTAVKLLPLDKTGERAVARFEKEVQLTAGLVHPNTITVFDYGRTPDGIFYYAMEYLDGGDLDDIVGTTGPMPASRVVHILAQASAGLAEAHEIGLIHRDIKPANILLASKGPVADLTKVVDFGLVRELDGRDASGLTHTNTVLGTPLYLAPEAISNPSEVDARVDIYALGAVAFYLLTGEHVFDGNTVVEICSHHLHTQPDSPSARLGQPVPEMLEEIVLNCLSKDPSGRPQSAEELHELLVACAEDEPWELADARAWWAAHGEEIRDSRRVPSDAISGSAATMEIDPAARA